MASSQTSTRTLPTLHEFFAPGGILSTSPLPYEYRPGQFEMAKAVERALTERRHLIVEAGTGTGKTLAYLLPALRTGQRVIISTGTKALQDQLFFRDVPFLESLLGDSAGLLHEGPRQLPLPPQARRPARSAHSCPASKRSTSTARSPSGRRPPKPATAPSFPSCPSPAPSGTSSTPAAKPASARPAPTTAAASSPRCAAAPSSPTSSSSTTTSSSPTSPSSSEAAGAPDAGILPEAAAVIFDEAHELEDVASSYFGLSVSNLRFEELARDTDVLLRGKEGAEKTARRHPAASRPRAHVLRQPAHQLATAASPSTTAKSSSKPPAISTSALRTTLRLLEVEMDLLTDVDEAPGLRKRVARLRTELEFLLESNASNMVYWLERRVAGGANNDRAASPGRGGFNRNRGTPFSRPLPSTSPNCCTSWSSKPFPPSSSPRPRSPCRAASNTSASASA